SDRYSLVVSIGWAVVLAGVFLNIWPDLRGRRLLLISLAILIPTLSLMSYGEIFVLRNSTRLFPHILAHFPVQERLRLTRVDFYSRLGRAHEQHGELSEAEQALQTAVRLQPEFAPGHYQLGGVLKAAGDPDGAKASFQTAWRLDPSLLPPFNDLGVA